MTQLSSPSFGYPSSCVWSAIKGASERTDKPGEMSPPRRNWSYWLASVGAAGLVGSLWAPWYTFRIPAAAFAGAEQLSGQFGAFGPLVREGANLLHNLGPLNLTAWQVLQQVPIVLVLAGGAGGGLALLALTDRARGAGRLVAWAGGVALAFAAFRTFVVPYPTSGLHAAWGAYTAVVSAVALLVGGLFGYVAEESESSWTPTPGFGEQASVPWSPAESVPPPSSV